MKKVVIVRKPNKPQKFIEVQQAARYDFTWVSKKVSWSGFQEWANEQIPKGATDITLELREDWEYDDCYTSLEIGWKLLVPNPRYEREIKKYKKAMIKWRKT